MRMGVQVRREQHWARCWAALLHEGVADVRAGNVVRSFGPRNAASAQRGTEFDWTAVPQTQLQYVQEARVTQQISMNLGDHLDHLLVVVKLALP